MNTVSSSPHISCEESVPKIMWNVVFALVPAALFGVIYFKINALIIVIVSILSAVLAECLVQKFRKQPISISDGSAVLTGLLLAMCMPPTIPAYMVGIGAAIAIVIGKHSMGGLGQNIFNPAHIGRAALMVSWPVAMTTWSQVTTSVDAVTSATPLNIAKMQGYDVLLQTYGGNMELYKALFFGTRNGCIGETCTILLLIGGAYLIYKKYVNWKIPVVMIGSVGSFTWVFGPNGFFTGDPAFHMMAGGLVIGAFFMATDMVTIPITKKGQLIFAFGAGLITAIIRLQGGYPEGVCYSILLMNALTPLIDRLVKPKIFGHKEVAQDV